MTRPVETPIEWTVSDNGRYHRAPALGTNGLSAVVHIGETGTDLTFWVRYHRGGSPFSRVVANAVLHGTSADVEERITLAREICEEIIRSRLVPVEYTYNPRRPNEASF